MRVTADTITDEQLFVLAMRKRISPSRYLWATTRDNGIAGAPWLNRAEARAYAAAKYNEAQP